MDKILVDKKVLEYLLMLIMDSQNTSASKSGLKKRGENLDKMKECLLSTLELTDEDADHIYWNKFEEIV